MLTKKQEAVESLKSKIHLMQCPICFNEFSLKENGLVICAENHSFDISKKGYINLLKQSPKENYEKRLFESRQKVIEAGMYEPLIDLIKEIISHQFMTVNFPALLDAGCGEGSHLNDLKAKISKPWLFLGLDIAKAGINLATDHRSDITWLVGDLAQLPIKDHGLDVILNILSPGHYESFKRVLKPGGFVLKVIPEKDYLKEIRQVLYPDQVYSNEEVRSRFEENFKVIEAKPIAYTFKISKTLKPFLLEMTPLTWQSSDKVLKALEIDEITVSLLILIGTAEEI